MTLTSKACPIVIDEGDTLLPFKMYARDRVTLMIEKGFLTRIDGRVTAEYIKSFNDPDAYAMAHLDRVLSCTPTGRHSAFTIRKPAARATCPATWIFPCLLARSRSMARFSNRPDIPSERSRHRSLPMGQSRCPARKFGEFGFGNAMAVYYRS